MEQKYPNSVLLVMDMQLGIIGNFSQVSTALISSTQKAIHHARFQQLPILYVTVGFRQESWAIRANNKGLAAIKERVAQVDMNVFTTIVPDLGRMDGEPQVMKRGLSAFAGSDLEMILKSLGIQHLILTGISTSGVVLSTMREAVDKDYRLTILADCCADADEEVHTILTTKVFPRHADVMSVADWIGADN